MRVLTYFSLSPSDLPTLAESKTATSITIKGGTKNTETTANAASTNAITTLTLLTTSEGRLTDHTMTRSKIL